MAKDKEPLLKEEYEEVYRALESVLDLLGGEAFLVAVGDILQSVEGSPNAAAVGKTIKALAEVEW